MIKPVNAGFNKETAEDNKFQTRPENLDEKTLDKQVLQEYEELKRTLRDHDIEVVEFEDTPKPPKPDAIFPNNWFSTHEDKCIVTYPMFAPSRRPERREDIVEALQEEFGYDKRYAFEYHEDDSQFLESTGSMVLDRSQRIVYASLSERTSIVVLEKFCVLLGYRKLIFHSTDKDGNPVYHTNVMMSIGNGFAVVCLDAISDTTEREQLVTSLKRDNKEIIELNMAQMHSFAGNGLQLKSKLGEHYFIMSRTAYNALDSKQIDGIAKYTKILSVAVPTIEQIGGGSVRCMLAEIF